MLPRQSIRCWTSGAGTPISPPAPKPICSAPSARTARAPRSLRPANWPPASPKNTASPAKRSSTAPAGSNVGFHSGRKFPFRPIFRFPRRWASHGLGMALVGHPPATDAVEEDRCREADGIDPIEHTAVAFDHGAPILQATVALDGGEDKAAEEAEDVDGQRDQRGLPDIEGRDPPQRGADCGRGEDAADQAFERFGGRNAGRQLVFAEQLAPHILEDVARL